MAKSKCISAPQLKKALGSEFERLVEDVAGAGRPPVGLEIHRASGTVSAAPWDEKRRRYAVGELAGDRLHLSQV